MTNGALFSREIKVTMNIEDLRLIVNALGGNEIDTKEALALLERIRAAVKQAEELINNLKEKDKLQ